MARSRILYFDLLLFLFAAFVLLEGRLFHLLFLFFLLLPPVSLLLTVPQRYLLSVRLAAEEDVCTKGTYAVGIDLVNRGVLPCAGLCVELKRRNRLACGTEEMLRFETALAPRERLDWHAEIDLPDCGRNEITIERAFVTDPLRLFRLPIAAKNRTAARTQLYVLPETVRRTMDAEKSADLGRDSDTYSLVKAGGDPAELFRLRDYQAGDARRSVHEKLSARWGKLIVREFGLPLSPSLCFLVQLAGRVTPREAEPVIATVLSVSEYLMLQDVPHRIGYIGEDGALTVHDVDSAAALADVLHALLSLPATAQGAALEQLLVTRPPQPESHLLLLSAGTETNRAAEDRLLLLAAEGGFCRRLTMLSSDMTPARAAHLRDLGCEAYLLDGRRPEGEEVF